MTDIAYSYWRCSTADLERLTELSLADDQAIVNELRRRDQVELVVPPTVHLERALLSVLVLTVNQAATDADQLRPRGRHPAPAHRHHISEGTTAA